MSTLDFDTIIIGSGFGGAVSACRLSEAGEKVLVLERGRRWDAAQYPRQPQDPWVWSQQNPLRHHGWLDLRTFPNMWVAAAAGVGGGSLIYASVSVKAPPKAFDQGWPEAINHESLAPYYDRVARMLDIEEIPDNQLTNRFELMRDAATLNGWADRFHKVPLAVRFDPNWNENLPDAQNNRHAQWSINAHGRRQGTCVHCGNCDIGCQVKAKNTLDLNYLAVAEDKGAQIRELHLVKNLEPLGLRGADGWRVHFDQITEQRLVRGSVKAKRVIVSAGSIGSTELLLTCRDVHGTLPNLSQRLGHRWTFNGDFVSLGRHVGRKVSPSQGPTITAAIDLLDGAVDGASLFVEDGGFPNVLAAQAFAQLKPGYKWHRLRKVLLSIERDVDHRKPLDSTMPWFGQGVDAGDGLLRLARTWYAPWRKRLALDWHSKKSESMVSAMIKVHEQLTTAAGGQLMVPPTWTLFHKLIPPHPLGGCAMADNIEEGVVDATGRVYGYQNLIVADGSIIPRPLGLNPSRTIAALAERNIEQLLND